MTDIQKALMNEATSECPLLMAEFVGGHGVFAVTRDSDGYIAIWAIEEPIDVVAGMYTKNGSWEKSGSYVTYIGGFFDKLLPKDTEVVPEVEVFTDKELQQVIRGYEV